MSQLCLTFGDPQLIIINTKFSLRISKNILVEASLLLVAVIWALNFSVVKSTLSELDPLSFNGLRFIFAAVMVWGLLIYKGQTFSIPREDWLPLLGVGLLGNLIYQGLFIIGIDYTHAANAAVMLGTTPIWVALFSHFFSMEKMNMLKSLGVLLAFGGIVFLVSGGSESLSLGSDTFFGDLVVLTAAIVWGGYSILSKTFLDRYSPIQFSAIMASIGSVVLFLIGLPNILELHWSEISVSAYGGLVYSGLISIGIAYLIWNYGLQKVGAVHTATYQNLVPVLGMIFGIVLLNEKLTILQFIGSGLVISGIVLARWKKEKDKDKIPARA
ncbi:MAG: EamA family transporter [Balneolaceae bacterium]|jgi:drug/metabolite transporter (DMT)-like permease